MIVRHAEARDAPALVALAEAVGNEDGGWILSSEWRSIADERRYLKSVRRHPDAVVLVAEIDGLVAGRLSLARDPHPASRHVADLGLMVDARFRRRGVGRALLEEAVAWAQRSGVRKLELHVFPHNEPALALYESFGFAREGYRAGQYLRDDEFVDAVLMAFEVPSGA